MAVDKVHRTDSANANKQKPSPNNKQIIIQTSGMLTCHVCMLPTVRGAPWMCPDCSRVSRAWSQISQNCLRIKENAFCGLYMANSRRRCWPNCNSRRERLTSSHIEHDEVLFERTEYEKTMRICVKDSKRHQKGRLWCPKRLLSAEVWSSVWPYDVCRVHHLAWRAPGVVTNRVSCAEVSFCGSEKIVGLVRRRVSMADVSRRRPPREA